MNDPVPLINMQCPKCGETGVMPLVEYQHGHRLFCVHCQKSRMVKAPEPVKDKDEDG